MRMFMQGEWVDRDAKLDVRNPYDDQVIDTVPRASADDVDAALVLHAARHDHARDLLDGAGIGFAQRVQPAVRGGREHLHLTPARTMIMSS